MTAAPVAVITIVSGRHPHLLQQDAGLRGSSCRPDLRVVVAIDDDHVAGLPFMREAGDSVLLTQLRSGNGRLPLAAARNRGAQLAVAAGAGVLIFLDVDCIPGPLLVERYAAAVLSRPAGGLCSGPVAYLGPPPAGGYDLDEVNRAPTGHPARPVPPDGTVVPGDHRLFWSLSFATSAATWNRLGGFSETYDGYGAEDTDFAQLAADAGIGHYWVGGAWAFHQYHPTNHPPVQHLHDIVRNANAFHHRWGWWPMIGWLTAFADMGLARHDETTDHWRVVA